MKTNKKTIQSAMDRRLSFLDELPSCRAAVQYRIAQEEQPMMKKKMSFSLALSMVIILLAAAALATAALLLSPRADAVRTADRALEEKYGITAEMLTFFAREEEPQKDGSTQVQYMGVSGLDYVLGTYTATVRDGKAEVSWSRDGEDTSGGYEADAWGIEQLKQMVRDSQDENLKQAYLNRAAAIARAHGAAEEDESSSEADEGYGERREADKTAAMKARRISEEEMIAIGREFIVSNYHLNEEKAGKLELYTNAEVYGEDPAEAGAEQKEGNGNDWYEMVNGVPCFKVEYLLYHTDPSGESLQHEEMDGFYNVFVNVETGEIEAFEFNSGLSGQG